nr:hypothetical protein [Acinetobacter sp. Marseille-Q1620]
MNNINTFTSFLGLITTVIAITLNIYVFHEHKRKKFKAELENYEDYFNKYYLTELDIKVPLLIRDKAAQNLVRNIHFDAKIVNYFISLHEQKLLSFDKAINYLFYGIKFINIDQNINFKINIRFATFFKNLNYLGYVIFLLYGINLLGKFTPFLNPNLQSSVQLFIGIGAIIIAFVCLKRAEEISDSLKFIQLIKNIKKN